MKKHSIHPLCKWSITRSWKPANVPPKLVPELRNCTTLYTVLRSRIRTGVMVLDYHPFVWPPWAAENSQRQTRKPRYSDKGEVGGSSPPRPTIPSVRSPVNTRLFSLFHFRGFPLEKPICQLF